VNSDTKLNFLQAPKEIHSIIDTNYEVSADLKIVPR